MLYTPWSGLGGRSRLKSKKSKSRQCGADGGKVCNGEPTHGKYDDGKDGHNLGSKCEQGSSSDGSGRSGRCAGGQRDGGIGGGDVYLAPLLGLMLGFSSFGAVMRGTFAGFFLGALFAIVLLLKGYGTKHRFAFGPFLIIGAIWALTT